MPRKLSSELKNGHFRVAIFGSARIRKGDERYRMVYRLAKKIAAEGMDIITGGGQGLMDAASRGHHAGRKNHTTHSIGLTIKLPQEQEKSFHLDIKKDFSRFSDRLDHLMALSNVAVVTPGGIGTLLELFYTWQLMQVQHICNTPIILLGKLWPEFLMWMKKWRICLASSGRNAFDSILSPSRGEVPYGDAGLLAPTSSVSKMLNKYKVAIKEGAYRCRRP